MGRTKGGTNRYWSKDEKLRIINRVIIDGLSITQVAKLESISEGMLSTWIKKYIEYGEASLENKNKPGNPLSKYANKKELSDMEKLEYENMKLRIENERLKKGYMMKGDGSIVMFKK
jgi:transposase-like protein